MIVFFESTVPPIEIARVKKNAALVTQIESKIKEEQTVIETVSTYFAKNIPHGDASPMNKDSNNIYARQLNINMGNQKNTDNSRLCQLVPRCVWVVTRLAGATFMPEVM